MNKLKKSFNPLYLIPVVAVLVVGAIVLFTGGGDDKGASGSDASLGFAEGDRAQQSGPKRPNPKPAPIVRNGIVDEARREGRLAVAQARGTIVTPTRVRIRVSAAPKQVVTVNWQLGCFKDGSAKIGRGAYRTRPPDVRQIPLPTQGAKNCIATAGAQLTKPDGEGRIKIAVIAG